MSRRHHGELEHPMPNQNIIFQIDFTTGLDEDFGASHIVNTDVYATPTIDAVKGLLTYNRKASGNGNAHVVYALTSEQKQRIASARKVVCTTEVYPTSYMTLQYGGMSFNLSDEQTWYNASYKTELGGLSESSTHNKAPLNQFSTIIFTFEKFTNGSGNRVISSTSGSSLTTNISNYNSDTLTGGLRLGNYARVGMYGGAWWGDTNFYIKSVKIECYE